MPTGVYVRKKNKKYGGFQKGHSLNNGRHWKMSKKGIENLRIAQLGKKHSQETKDKMSKVRKGKACKEETKIKIGNANRGKPNLKLRGENSHLWKGGVTSIHRALRTSLEYKLWRRAVYERDNYTCVWCGDKTSGNLEADHIKRFADYPELRFAIDNGRTLCKKCHRTTETYGR